VEYSSVISGLLIIKEGEGSIIVLITAHLNLLSLIGTSLRLSHACDAKSHMTLKAIAVR
jgi:hypothetical protein